MAEVVGTCRNQVSEVRPRLKRHESDMKSAPEAVSRLVRTVGVVGAGQMGSGIAEVAALANLEVVMVDKTDQALANGLQTIRESLDRFVEKKALSNEQAQEAIRRIRVTTHLKEMADRDFVIEAIGEDEDLKRTIFNKLDRITPKHAILATNTSALSITRIAGATKRPEKVLGVHFLNPPAIVKLVEITKGMGTDYDTYHATKELVESMGKVTCTSADRPGFIINRILMPMINEAFFVLMEGVSSAEEIDLGLQLGTNLPLGPLSLADFLGLDVCLSTLQSIHKGTGDGKYRPCPLLVQYVDAGKLGRKTGCGVYTYFTSGEKE